MPRKSAAQQSRRSADLEELRPDRFVVRNSLAHGILKGEGDLHGSIFVLTTWRRDGLLARLRNHGLTVVTLADQVAALPDLPAALPIGAACTRALAANERFSRFDPQIRNWTPVEAQPGSEPPQVLLHAGWVVRKRRGRGSPAFYRVMEERNRSAGLTPLDETAALLQGYAQARTIQRAPLVARTGNDEVILPDVPLPAPHRKLLERIGTHSAAGWQVAPSAAKLAHQVYACLGLQVRLPPGKK